MHPVWQVGRPMNALKKAGYAAMAIGWGAGVLWLDALARAGVLQ